MKFKFNETNIVTGYIKELLKDFNLPVYTVACKGKKLYKNKIYIYNDKIFKCTSTKIFDGSDLGEQLNTYVYNKSYINFTKNLIIDSSIYDAYTHTYLGNYLRFLRDYKNINLMPLYNCFNTERPVGLNYILEIDKYTKYNVNTSDNNYNYYIIPAKFNEEYTININSLVPYELSCIIYTGDNVLDISKEISKLTYTKVNSTGSNCSYLYSIKNIAFESKLPDVYKDEFWKQEPNLRILLKLPKSVTSSIAVLEGNYLANNNICGNTLISNLCISDEALTIDAITKLSLLENTSSISYPFADRLVEYLLGNVISNLETIPTNVAKVTDKLISNTLFEDESGKGKMLKFKGFYDTWDNYIKLNILRKLSNVAIGKKDTEVCSNLKLANYNILSWTGSGFEKQDKFKYIRPIDEYYDLLGYVDKDAEQNLNLVTKIR